MRGERIQLRQKQERIQTKEILEFLNITGSTLSRWKNDINEPDDETKMQLATILNTSVAYLMGETDNPETEHQSYISFSNDIIELTVYDISTVVSCGTELSALHSSQRVEVIFTNMDSIAQYDKNNPPFSVMMPNDSMRGAGINEGNYVVINPVESAESGQPAFVIYNGSGLIRWVLKKADGSVELQPANTDYALIKVEQEYVNNEFKFKVIGRVVEILIKKTPKDAF